MPGTWARYGRGAARVARANLGRLPAPMKLTFAVTYWCQYRCATCNIWQRKPVDELTTDEILAFIARNRKFVWADVTGGEIFLRPDIADLIEAMIVEWRSLAVLHFPTNGFLTDRITAAARRLARRGPTLVATVSVDGDEALNDELRGIKGGFERQMATFRGLREIPGVRAVLGMTLSAANAGAFDRTFEACSRACPGLRIEDIHINAAQFSDHYYGNTGVDRVTAPPDAVRDAVRRQRARLGWRPTPAAWLERQFLSRLETFLTTGRTPMPCHALRSSCFVDPWGTVFPCLTYSRPMGELRRTGMDLAPIWESAAVRGVQGEIWKGQCPQCWTACDAYPSILGNALRPGGRRPAPAASRG